MAIEVGNEGLEIEILERLRTTILSGALPPGTKLSEETLAETFEVSRTRIRPVLQWLAFEQLVDLRKNRGAFITSPSPKDARDVFEARRVIERVTTGIVARTVLTPSLAQLRAHIGNQELAALQGDRQKGIRESGEFHRHLAALAHNSALATVLETLILRTSLIVALYGSARSLRNAIDIQKQIVDLLERGQSERAANAMERCLYSIERELDLVEAPLRDVDLRRAIETAPRSPRPGAQRSRAAGVA